MYDYLFENSKMYKDLVKEGEIKGREEGIEAGRAQGEQKGIRESIEAVVQMRFPSLLDLARKKIEQIHEPQTLHDVLVAMVAASTERKARGYLLALHKNP